MHVVKIAKFRNSRAIIIPENILNNLDINLDDENTINQFQLDVNEKNQIILTQLKKESYLKSLFKDDEVSNDERVVVDWGEPRGHELL